MPDKEIFSKIKDAIFNAVAKEAYSNGQLTNKEADKITINDSPTKKEKSFVPVVGRYVQQVKTHNRKGKRVKAHQRFYNGYIPIQLQSGQWRMVSRVKKPASNSSTQRYTEKDMESLIVNAIKQAFN